MQRILFITGIWLPVACSGALADDRPREVRDFQSEQVVIIKSQHVDTTVVDTGVRRPVSSAPVKRPVFAERPEIGVVPPKQLVGAEPEQPAAESETRKRFKGVVRRPRSTRRRTAAKRRGSSDWMKSVLGQ